MGSGEKVRVLAVVVLHCYLDHLHPYKELGVNVGSSEKVRVLAVMNLHCHLDHLHPYKDLAAVKR